MDKETLTPEDASRFLMDAFNDYQVIVKEEGSGGFLRLRVMDKHSGALYIDRPISPGLYSDPRRLDELVAKTRNTMGSGTDIAQ
ncbi:hypothetical protein GCM10027040_24340 [Halomonas shantousis]